MNRVDRLTEVIDTMEIIGSTSLSRYRHIHFMPT